MKKISLILLTLLFIFSPISCKSEESFVLENLNNDIYFAFDICENGRVEQKISFPTQEKQMNLSEENKQKYIENLCLEIKSKLFFPFFLNFYTTSVIGQGEYKIGEDLTYEQPYYDEGKQTISFSFVFNDTETWNFFHPKNNDEEGLKVVKGVFIDKGKSESNFLFSEKLEIEGEEKTYGEFLSTILSTVQDNFCSQEINAPKLAYVYSHFSTKLHTNADKVIHFQNKTISIWEGGFDELEKEKKIELYVYSPNRIVWYTIALCVIVLFMFIAVVVYKLRNKKLREKN